MGVNSAHLDVDVGAVEHAEVEQTLADRARRLQLQARELARLRVLDRRHRRRRHAPRPVQHQLRDRHLFGQRVTH